MSAQDEKYDPSVLREILNGIHHAENKMIRLFNEEPLSRQYMCRQGLSIRIAKVDDYYYLDMSLDHLSKERITDLFYRGEIIDEMLLLYELGHLPFADTYVMKMTDAFNTHIVDRVRIHLDKAFNVFDRAEWAKHDEQVFEKARSFANLNECESFYAQLKEAKHKKEADPSKGK